MMQTYNRDASEPTYIKENIPPSNMAARRRDDSTVASSRHDVDDWEEWEDDDVITLIDINESSPTHRAKMADKGPRLLHANGSNASTDSFHNSLTQTNNSPTASFWEPSPIDRKPQQNLTVPSFAPGRSGTRHTRYQSRRVSSKHTASRISRHKSHKGKTVLGKLKLVTDMTKFRRPYQTPNQIRSPQTRPKFVDLAALAALEGEPTAESVGNWNWLKGSHLRSPEVLSPPQNPRSPDQQLSPEDRPIVIGISLPSDEAASHSVSPRTATIETYSPVGQQSTRLVLPGPSTGRSNPFSDTNQPKSVWSPDTPDTACSFSSIRRTSSVYSQATMVGAGLGATSADVPPVPALPANYKKTPQQKFISLHVERSGEDEDDTGTPCTLFEEDGTPAAMKAPKGKLSAITPDSANSQNNGWWDHHVVTPFLDRTMSFASRTQRGESSIEQKGVHNGREGLSSPNESSESPLSNVYKPQQDYLILPSSIFQASQRLSDPVKRDVENRPGTENPQKDITVLPATRPNRADDDCLLITFDTESPSVPITNHLVKAEHLPRNETEVLSSTQVKLTSGDPSSSNAMGLNSEREIVTVSKPILVNVQAPIVRIPTPRQTASARLIVPQTSSGRSTPTLRIPTPRRTPSPAANVVQVQAPYESITRFNPENPLGIQEKPRTLSIDRVPVDVPPPYSPPKKQTAAPVRYQAVFPPDHPMNTNFPPNRTGSPGLASTMTSQGPGRRVEDVPVKPTEKLAGENINMVPIPSQPVVSDASKEASRDEQSAHQPSKAVIVQDLEQSRFSLSPVSPADSSASDDDLRSVERYIMPARNQSSPFPAQPVGRHVEDQFYDLESLPTNPARAYLAHEPVASPPNLSGGSAQSGGHGYTTPLPIRPTGTYLPEEHAHPAHGRANKVERVRRRHEKEDVAARRAGGFWRGRGCIPARGCFGQTGREGRKKRRIWLCVITAIIAIIILAIVLALMLTRHHGTHQVHSIWVNLTDYPPMPTGVLTFVGPDNTVAKSGCTEPSTLWSCSLPRDDQDSVAPYKPNQPTVVFQIQWDNSTSKGWKVPNGDTPTPVSRRGIRTRDTIDGFQPNPDPPSFKEMWFLGETTDDIKSSEKAGEPAPFFISILNSVNDTVNSPTLARKRGLTGGNNTLAGLLPPPDLEADSTPKPAVMIPQPVHQPVRLYDRGLPTEHYGFYTYFKRTIYLKSVTVLNTTEGNVPLDEDGGCRKNEANYLVTWAQTRMLVQIWTRQLDGNTTSLLKSGTDGGINKSTQLIRPGTMPYPVTLTLDTHGGNPKEKVVWDWPMDSRQKVSVNKADLLVNNMAAGGTWINHRGSGDAKFGGFDGGSGGCKCQWVNFV